MRRLLALAALPALLAACAPAEPPDLILHGGRVVTQDPDGPADASAVVLRGGVIVAVEDDAAALARRGEDTRVVDLDGAVVVPGLADSHGHLAGLGKALAQIDLVDTPSAGACVRKVAGAVAADPDGGWLEGRGWDQNDWEVKAWPDRAMLDAVTGTRPCLLRRVDGHAAWANSAALEAAGITRATADPDGGAILRGPDGEPTGILVDNAVDLVRAVIPAPDEAEVRRRVLLAQEHCLAHGLTQVHDAGVSWEHLQLYREMAEEGELVLRYYGMVADDPASLEAAFAHGPVEAAGGRFTVRCVKLYADGALGSRGALLLEDYADDPGNRGLAVSPVAHMTDVCRRAAAAGYQVATHAIGDAANRAVLDMYEAVTGELGLEDHRWRVEHAQILDPADIPRFGALGVVAAMQPVHCTSDMDWADERLGDGRLEGAYAWRSLRDAHAEMCFGTDFPVERVSALASLYAARTRMHPGGTPAGGWQPHETLTGPEALELYTLGSAHAGFMEERVGRIAPGYRGDLTVLSGDPATVAPEALLGLDVVMVVVDGVIREGR